MKRQVRINEKITARYVRLIGPEGNQLGIVALPKALEIANQYDLDLVEVAPAANPPVCRIIDYSKFKYDQEKKEREAKKHQHHGKLKEIRLKPHINEHDYQTKLRQAIEFLQERDKVKVSLLFRGRQMEHVELGRKLIDKLIADTHQVAEVEKPPVLEGKMLSLVLAPK